MPFDILHNVDIRRNRLLRAGLQLLTDRPSDSLLGEVAFFDVAATAAESRLRLGVCDAESGNFWAYLTSLNRTESIIALWTWNPPVIGAGTANKDRSPFTVGTNSAFQPAARLANWVEHLNADLLDGYHTLAYNGTVAPGGNAVPIYSGTGQVAVADPLNDYDAVNRKTWQAGLTGLIVLTQCRVATTNRLNGTRTGNNITAAANGILSVDGINPAVTDRVLVKNQEIGGSAIDNGVYTVTAAGSAGSAWALTRATDADITGELTVGSLVFISQGTTQIATQWACQKAPGASGTVIAINTEENFWRLAFQASAYTAGRGMALNGLEFNFCQNADYVRGSLFTASDLRIVQPLLPPNARRFLFHDGNANNLPQYGQPTIADISDWPNPVLGTGTVGRHARWAAAAKTLENSNLIDSGNAVNGAGNSLATAPVGLGDASTPFKDVWLNTARLKQTAGAFGLETLLGFADVTGDPNANHREVRTWTPTQVKSWLSLSTGDVGAVPTSRALTINGTAGQITVTPSAAQDLSQDRSWTVGLSISLLDAHWMTLDTAQSATGQKTWESATGVATEAMVRFRAGTGTAFPQLQFTAGGAIHFGDGVAAPTGVVDFSANRIRASGKPVWFDTGASVKLDTALAAGGGAPTTLLGLDATNFVRGVSASDLSTFLGAPWMTLTTDQTVTGVKTWESATLSKVLVSFREAVGGKVPSLSMTAGGAIHFGDGVVAPTGVVDFSANRIRVSGKPVWFDTGASVKIDTALVAGVTPVSLLGLDATNFVKLVTAADLSAFLGAPWMTLTTDQTVTGVKTWESATLTKVMISMREAVGGKVPSLSFTAGGAILFGDGTVTATGSLDFNTGSMRFSVKPVWFDTASTIKINSAAVSSGAPTTLLGLDATSIVRQVSATDLRTYLGAPTLAQFAIGYGDAAGRLTGDASKLRWDYTNERLGIRVASPAETLDMLGTFKLTNNVTTGLYPGAQFTVTDTSANSADWTSRTMYGLSVSTAKTGTATFVTSATITSLLGSLSVSSGSVTNAIASRSILQLGAAASGPVITAAYGFYSSFTAAAGSVGSIAKLVHFYANDLPSPFIQPAEVYGVQIPQLTSLTGAARTAGIRLDLTTTGVGERYNIYAPGTAVSYFAGNIGLGQTAPSARIEFAVGTTTLAPVRFASTSSSAALLTTPLAGMLESRGDRLTFTDTTPTRRLLAHLDDVDFTNDPNAEMQGAVNFYGPVAASMATSILDGQVIGAGDFAISVRFRVPVSVGSNSGLFALTSSITNGTGPYDVNAYLATNLNLVVFIRDAAGSAGAGAVTWTVPNAANAGRIVDFVLTRSGGVVAIYQNAIGVTPVPTGTAGNQAAPVCNSAATLRFSLGNYASTQAPLQDRVYRAAVFNRGLSASEVLDLCRHGINEPDKWSNTTALHIPNWSAGVDGWVAARGNLNGTGGELAYTSTDASGGNTTNFTYKGAVAVVGKRFRLGYQAAQVGALTSTMAWTAAHWTGSIVVANPALSAAWQDYGIEGICNSINACMATATQAVTAGQGFKLRSLAFTRIGCIVNLDFGLIHGTQVWDWSGRYPATLTGTYEIVRPASSPLSIGGGTDVIDGSEIVMVTRKWSKRFQVSTAGTVNLDHNLGTKNVTVMLWDETSAQALKVEAAINLPTVNRATVAVANIRTSPSTLRAVVVG